MLCAVYGEGERVRICFHFRFVWWHFGALSFEGRTLQKKEYGGKLIEKKDE